MELDLKAPIRLAPSRAWRTYLGGKSISALHGEDGEDGHFPEEWLMSAVSARNAGREDIVEGLSTVYGTAVTFRELMEKYPCEMLGERHVTHCGTSPGVLVKLLDAAERLTIQCHPTKETAKRLLGSAFGKTECWHILDCRTVGGEEPCIYIGFREGVTRREWERCFREQDIVAMLACLHRVPVKKGDTYIVRGGVPHAIGTGCFLVEIQEPTDYTIRTERVTPSGLEVAESMLHQGLGFEAMFDCFTYEGLSFDEAMARYRVEPSLEKTDDFTVRHVISQKVTDLFALDILEVTGEMTLLADGRFSGLYVLSGHGSLGGESIETCDHYFLPADCRRTVLCAAEGETLRVARFFGPHADIQKQG